MNFSSLLRYEGMTLEIVIWSLFIGIVIGVFGSFYVKQILGAFVRKLLSENANSPQNAKSLEETGFGGNPFVINALDGTGSLRRLIRCADEADDADDDTDGGKAKSKKQKRAELLAKRWYIPTELCDRAEILYDNKGNTIGVALIAIAAFLIAALISFTVIPDLVQMASNAFSSFGA